MLIIIFLVELLPPANPCILVCAGELFAHCPIESYPSAAIEQVLDSSRYFVVRIQDGGGCLNTFYNLPDIQRVH